MSEVHGDDAPADPLALAGRWVPGAGEERMTMTLGTRGRDGHPASRTVVLSDFDGEVFSFHTDSRSAKAAEIAADARVSLTLLWPDRPSQLVVAGTAALMDASRAAEAYALRSPYLRRLAWLNTREYALLSRTERQEAWDAFAGPTEAAEPPATWVGYDVVPERLTFWSTLDGAASRRLAYRRDGSGWTVAPLPG